MAIAYLGNTISGVSGDTKPTLTANEKGVIFIETDTNKIYRIRIHGMKSFSVMHLRLLKALPLSVVITSRLLPAQ